MKCIEDVCHSTTTSGTGKFTKKCHTFFEQKYGFKKRLLATSCTDAPSLQFKEAVEKTVRWYLKNEEWMNNITSSDYEKYYELMC